MAGIGSGRGGCRLHRRSMRDRDWEGALSLRRCRHLPGQKLRVHERVGHRCDRHGRHSGHGGQSRARGSAGAAAGAAGVGGHAVSRFGCRRRRCRRLRRRRRGGGGKRHGEGEMLLIRRHLLRREWVHLLADRASRGAHATAQRRAWHGGWASAWTAAALTSTCGQARLGQPDLRHLLRRHRLDAHGAAVHVTSAGGEDREGALSPHNIALHRMAWHGTVEEHGMWPPVMHPT